MSAGVVVGHSPVRFAHARSEPRGFWCSPESYAGPGWRPGTMPSCNCDGELFVVECQATDEGLCDSCLLDFSAMLWQLTEGGRYVDDRSILESLAEDVALGRPGAAAAYAALTEAIWRGVGLLFDPVEPIPDRARAVALASERGISTAEELAPELAGLVYAAAAEAQLAIVAREISAAVVEADRVICS